MAGTDEPDLVRATDVPIGLTSPSFGGDRLYAMGMKGGRFRLFSIARDKTLSEERVLAPPHPFEPWPVPSRSLASAHDYEPLSPRNWQLEDAFAALGGGNGVFGGGFLLFQDMMRDRTVVVQGQTFGSAELTDLQLLYLDRSSRVSWGTVGFLTPGFVLDPEFSTNEVPIWFLEQRIGASAIVEYPFNRYFRVGGTLGAAANRRTIPKWLDNFQDTTGRAIWEDRNGGITPELLSGFEVGYDTLRQSWDTGPLSGSSVVASLSGSYQPERQSWFGDVQVDAHKYFRVYKTANLGFRGAWGQALGDEWRRPFYLSSVDNLRGVPWYQFDYLISDKFVVGEAELQVPLSGLIRIALLDQIEGIAAVDAGSLFDDYGDAEQNATAAFVTGANFSLAVFEFRLHFARPFDIGGLVPGETRSQDGRVLIPDGWVTNFSVRYRWF